MWTVWCSPSFLCSILTQYQLVLLHVYFCSLHICIMYHWSLHVCTSNSDQITARRRRTADEKQAMNNIKPVINYALLYQIPVYKTHDTNFITVINVDKKINQAQIYPNLKSPINGHTWTPQYECYASRLAWLGSPLPSLPPQYLPVPRMTCNQSHFSSD